MVVQAQLDLPFPKKLGYGLKILETRSKREYVQVLRPLESFPFGEVEAAVAPLERIAEEITDDQLTRELLRTIAAEEPLTLAWFRDAYESRKAS